MKAWLFLLSAIGFEVVGTTALKASDSFSRLLPSMLTVVCYGAAFYCLSFTLRTIPTGVAYALWSGIGIVLITAVSWLMFGQKLDAPALVGMALIVAGVVVMNVFSKAAAH
ncbi:MAG: SMR family transporter [Pseudoxanthomonas sp.]